MVVKRGDGSDWFIVWVVLVVLIVVLLMVVVMVGGGDGCCDGCCHGGVSLCDCGRSVYFLNFCHDHGI